MQLKKSQKRFGSTREYRISLNLEFAESPKQTRPLTTVSMIYQGLTMPCSGVTGGKNTHFAVARQARLACTKSRSE